jgi:hypothetical protein
MTTNHQGHTVIIVHERLLRRNDDHLHISVAVTSDYFKEARKHYVTVWILSDWKSGKEHLTEPDKLIEMQWRGFDSLPHSLFLPWQQLLNS